MEFNNKVVMSIDDWKQYKDDDNISLAFGRITFLSNKPNTHKHIYSIDVIKQYAPTYLGKFVVAEYDDYIGDATTHTQNQTIVGYIPTTQEVQYELKEDGYWYASVDVVISKIYAPNIYNLFKTNNYRSVSVEQLVGFTDETEKYIDGKQDKIIVGFEGIGITILGMKYNPSIQGANIQLTKMSSLEVDNIENEYVKYSQKESNSEVVSMKDIMTKLEDIEQKLNKEETMSKINENVEEEQIVLNAETNENSTEETMAEDTQQVEIEKDACGQDEKMEETQESEDTIETCEETKMAELSEELNKANDKIAEYESKISKYESEISELIKFKENVQANEKNAIIAETLSKAKEFLDDVSYSEFVKRAEECNYECINGWKNEVLATIAERALAKMSEITSKEDGIVDMGMPEQTKETTSIFD